MDPAKVSVYSPKDIEAAMILMQMASGLPCSEFGKIQMKSIPKRASLVENIVKVRPSVTRALTQPKKATLIKVVNQMVPPKKRKLVLKDVISPDKPAKVFKMTTDATKSTNRAVPSIVCVQAMATPKTKIKGEVIDETKWNELRLKIAQQNAARQLRERETFDKLRTFFKDHPVNSAEFMQTFIQNV